ncbi:hypothetical protein [Streptomyces erythrochromogenes]|uniref:hypothetical protein n=1 Tax=Streptomyces erythrochromogenes TaxID=285574 RepID=UPI00367D675B
MREPLCGPRRDNTAIWWNQRCRGDLGGDDGGNVSKQGALVKESNKKRTYEALVAFTALAALITSGFSAWQSTLAADSANRLAEKSNLLSSGYRVNWHVKESDKAALVIENRSLFPLRRALFLNESTEEYMKVGGVKACF